MAWSRWLLLPWWLVRVGSTDKSFKDNPVLGSPALNRRGLHVARARLAHLLAGLRRRRLRHLVGDGDRAALDRDGFVCKRDFATPAQFAAMVAEIAAYTGPTHEFQEGDAVTRRIALTAATLRRMPATRAVVESAELQSLLRYVASFDIAPALHVQTIQARAVPDARTDPQTALHMDTFHPTMKAWLFLGEVTDDGGPFMYVPGSHRLTRRRLAWQRRQSVRAARGQRTAGGAFRVRPAELRSMRYPEPRRFAVPANTLVVADTCGFHARAPSPKATTRVEIFAYSRHNPFLPWPRFPGAALLPRLQALLPFI